MVTDYWERDKELSEREGEVARAKEAQAFAVNLSTEHADLILKLMAAGVTEDQLETAFDADLSIDWEWLDYMSTLRRLADQAIHEAIDPLYQQHGSSVLLPPSDKQIRELWRVCAAASDLPRYHSWRGEDEQGTARKYVRAYMTGAGEALMEHAAKVLAEHSTPDASAPSR